MVTVHKTKISHIFICYLLLIICNVHREQHLEKKIEQLTAEAKAKMAKKDKKGKICTMFSLGKDTSYL